MSKEIIKVSRIYDMCVVKAAGWLAVATKEGLVSMDLNLLEIKDLDTKFT